MKVGPYHSALHGLHAGHGTRYAWHVMLTPRAWGLAAFVWAGLGLYTPAARAVESDGLGPDKALHFSVSVGLTLGASLAFDVIGLDEPEGLPLSIGFALSLGVGKELFDALRGTGFSAADLTWDVLGVATGVFVRCVLRALFAPARASPRVTSF